MEKLHRPSVARKQQHERRSEKLFERLEQRVDLGESEQSDPRIDEFRQTIRQMKEISPFGNLSKLLQDLNDDSDEPSNS